MAEYTTSIDIEAPPEVIFDFLVTEEGMTAWMGDEASLNPVRDGSFAVDIAGYHARGTYLEVDRPRRVRVSWGFEESPTLPPGSSTVSFDLIATDTGTRVILVHADLPDGEVPGHAAGWEHFVPRLVLATAGEDLPPDTWTPNDTPIAVVQAYHQAWTSGDVDRAMTYVSADAQCFAPDENIRTRDDWRRYLTGFVPMLTGAPEHSQMIDGPRVALWYFPQTAVTSTTLASELFTVEDGKIIEIRLAFDRLGYVPREKQPR